MNDLEHDLRTLLEAKAAGAGTPEPDPQLLRRARRRQLGTALAGALVTAAVVAGAVIAIKALAPAERMTPAEPSEVVDTNVNGITISHPESWYVVDPVEAGIEPADNDLPHLVLFVSDADPMATGTLGCPGLTDGATNGFVLTLQEEPLALAGEGAREWPVELVPMGGSSSTELDAGDSACYPGWTFLRASWTASGRTFEARVGTGPDITEADRLALETAFARLRFAPTETGPGSVVIATGTAGGEDWELIATRESDGLGLMLQWASGGMGMGMGGMSGVPDDLQFEERAFGQGAGREVVVFGATRPVIARVEAVPASGGPAVSVTIVHVPDPIGGRLNAFVLVYPDPGAIGATLTAYDSNGGVVATGAALLHPGGD